MMRTRWPALVFAAWVAPAAAQVSDNTIRIRALGPHLSEAVITYVANNAAPFRLSTGELSIPEAQLTPRRVINQHCGALRDAYWLAFLGKNGKPATLSPDQPIGRDDAARLEWPACLYVNQPPRG